MLRARKLGVLTPCVLCVEHEASTIYFERVDGTSVKHALSSSALQPAGADSPYDLPACRPMHLSHIQLAWVLVSTGGHWFCELHQHLWLSTLQQGACLALHCEIHHSLHCPCGLHIFNRAWSAWLRSSTGPAASHWQRNSHAA